MRLKNEALTAVRVHCVFHPHKAEGDIVCHPLSNCLNILSQWFGEGSCIAQINIYALMKSKSALVEHSVLLKRRRILAFAFIIRYFGIFGSTDLELHSSV